MWIRLERCIQAPSLSHMGDDIATELITFNSKKFKLVTEGNCLKMELATLSQKHDVLREPQQKHWEKAHYSFFYGHQRIKSEISNTIEESKHEK